MVKWYAIYVNGGRCVRVMIIDPDSPQDVQDPVLHLYKWADARKKQLITLKTGTLMEVCTAVAGRIPNNRKIRAVLVRVTNLWVVRVQRTLSGCVQMRIWWLFLI